MKRHLVMHDQHPVTENLTLVSAENFSVTINSFNLIEENNEKKVRALGNRM